MHYRVLERQPGGRGGVAGHDSLKPELEQCTYTLKSRQNTVTHVNPYFSLSYVTCGKHKPRSVINTATVSYCSKQSVE
jgi:hypothetical protein